MGVHKLWDILESCKKTLPLQHLQSKRLCIDLSCWIIQLQCASKTTNKEKTKPFLTGLFHRLRALIALNCTLILVTDGSIPALKKSTYRKRLGFENESSQDETIAHKKSSLKRNMGSEFSRMIKDAKDLSVALGISCLDGLEEAEAQCALLNSESLCDGCFTTDSDAFLFGAKTVYREICLGDGGYVVCYEMVDIESKLGFGRNSLIALALLLGGDYSHKVHGISRESACQIVQSVGDSNILNQIISGSFCLKKKAKKKSSQSLVCDADKENINKIVESHQCKNADVKFKEVVDAYLKPTCHSAESDEVLRATSQQPFRLDRLHQFCLNAFGWPPEKTDEYLLPKLAERDLRRLAHLRSLTSVIGISMPQQKMLAGFHVDSVLKHRKVNGKDCYEVSWEGAQGLKTSVFPEDLLLSACPEKIAEFKSKAAKKQEIHKRPPKSKVCATNTLTSTLAQVETRLQTLGLACECSSTGGSTGRQTPVIDLLSPSPIHRQKKHVDCNTLVSRQIDVIQIDDSDEDEPLSEHEKKVTELRAFLASIKDDISL